MLGVGCWNLQIIEISKYAVLSANNARHQISFLVGIGHALAVDNSLSRSRHIVPDNIQRFFNFTDFIECYGCAGITFNTAGTLANLQVAAETLGDDFARNQHSVHIYNRRNPIHNHLPLYWFLSRLP